MISFLLKQSPNLPIPPLTSFFLKIVKTYFPLHKWEEGSNHKVLIFLFRLSLNAVKFDVKPTVIEYRNKNCAAQFCIFTTEIKENGRAVILNLLSLLLLLICLTLTCRNLEKVNLRQLSKNK